MSHYTPQAADNHDITLSNAELFNCWTNCSEPDWTQFTALEIGGCITVPMNDGGTYTEGLQSFDRAEFFTVYGRLMNGTCEAITDCRTLDAARLAAAELSILSGLTVKVSCSSVVSLPI